MQIKVEVKLVYYGKIPDFVGKERIWKCIDSNMPGYIEIAGEWHLARIVRAEITEVMDEQPFESQSPVA